MSIWAIADLHFSFGVPGKKMDLFGENWRDHDVKIRKSWKELVQPDDLVLLAGDISWAMKLPEVIPDLEWIDSLPGTKLMIRGNHDYWWGSPTKIRDILPPTIHFIHNNAYRFEDVEIGGARLWDYDFNFNEFIEFRENPKERPETAVKDDEKIYRRELTRLELSLKEFQDPQSRKIVMTHYPPVDAKMNPTPASDLLERYQVSTCVFGHLHNVRPGSLPFGEARGVRYILTSCDYTDFKPVKII